MKITAKKILFTIGPLLGIGALVVGFFGYPVQVIVSATVLTTRLDLQGQGFPGLPGKYLSSINLTLSDPSQHPVWSVRSDCPLSQGQQIAVRIPSLQTLYGFTPPRWLSANTTLYREQGISYIQWNGC